MEIINLSYFLVVGGGAAGCMAAVKAKQKSPDSSVLVLEKANMKKWGNCYGNGWCYYCCYPWKFHRTIRRSTIANDGILDQSAVHKTGLLGFDVIQELEEWGVKFQKDNEGKYDLNKFIELGSMFYPCQREGFEENIISTS